MQRQAKTTAGPSTTLFARSANNFAQDDTFWGGPREREAAGVTATATATATAKAKAPATATAKAQQVLRLRNSQSARVLRSR
jgi:hypothetical protein